MQNRRSRVPEAIREGLRRYREEFFRKTEQVVWLRERHVSAKKTTADMRPHGDAQ